MITVPSPASHTGFVGHEAEIAQFMRMIASGRIPQGLLLAGPYGVGKATLAFRIARALLAGQLSVSDALPETDMFGTVIAPPPPDLQVPADHPVARRIAAGAHGDLLVVERPLADDGIRRKGEVPVDLVRKIPPFLHKTASEEGWRIVIVDDADRMNRNAQNAILKVLEEPPKQAMLILVAQSASSLLPTIRSRCQMIAMGPLPEAQIADMVRIWHPEITEDECHLVCELAAGSPGRAAEILQTDGLVLWQKLDQIIFTGGQPREMLKLAETLARSDVAQAQLVIDLLKAVLYRRIRARAADLSGLQQKLVLDGAVALWDRLGADLALAQRRYLDLKPVFYRLFREMAQLWVRLGPV